MQANIHLWTIHPLVNFWKKVDDVAISKPSDCLQQTLNALSFGIFVAAIKALDTKEEKCLHFLGEKGLSVTQIWQQ